jgi:hypothetical protein
LLLQLCMQESTSFVCIYSLLLVSQCDDMYIYARLYIISASFCALKDSVLQLDRQEKKIFVS